MRANDYRDLLLKQWRLIILCALFVGIGAALGSFLIPTTYQSTVTVQLITPSVNTTLLGGADRILQTETTLATSDTILAQVVTQYPGLTTDQLKKEITTQTVDNTDLFQITISDRDPGRAASLANALAAVLLKQYTTTVEAANTRSQKPLQDSIALLQKQIDTTQTALTAAQSAKPPDPQQIQTLQNQLSDLQSRYTQAQQALATAQSNETKMESFLQVAQAAKPGTGSSRLPLLLRDTPAGLCFGLLLGVSFVLLRGRLDQSVRTVPAMIKLLGWPVLAEISAPSPDSWGSETGASKESPAQIYQKLDQSLAFFGIDTPLFSILVTGALPGETANVVAGDLALFLAGEGKRVLLMDANFSQPSQSRLFETPTEPGLGAAILALSKHNEELSLQPYLHRARGAPSLLRVLPAGPIPPNPEQVLKSHAMQAVLDSLRDTGADIVVLAGPPVSQSAGACALAAQVDGVIVVIDSPRTGKGKLAQIKTRLEESGARVLGCVVSGEPLNQPVYRQPAPNRLTPPEQNSLLKRMRAR